MLSFPVSIPPCPITSRVCYKTPHPFDNYACMLEFFFTWNFVRSSYDNYAQLSSCLHPSRQLRLFVVENHRFFRLFSRLSSLLLYYGRIFAAQPAPHCKNQPCLLHCLVFTPNLKLSTWHSFLSSLSTFYFALSTS